MCIRIFVYGSLKPDEYNYFVCADRVIFSTPAIAYGSLYHLPFGYPAMTEGSNRIQGYLLTFDDPEMLTLLDEFETHEPELLIPFAPTQNCDYTRHSVEVFDLDGRSLGKAWTYLMTEAQIKCLQGVRLTTGSWSAQN